MNNKAIILSGVIVSFIVVGVVVFSWMNWSKNYIVRWHMPSSAKHTKSEIANANVCIEPKAGEELSAADCAEVLFFPHLYSSIGVSEQRVIQWQESNGFHSEGVDRTGNILAPGYPIFSRLAWTVIDPVYIGGDELQELIAECVRIRQQAQDPVALSNVSKILDLASRAQSQSRTLRFS
jgi:hypothetical protein